MIYLNNQRFVRLQKYQELHIQKREKSNQSNIRRDLFTQKSTLIRIENCSLCLLFAMHTL